jgi:hypothetical protein
MHLIVRDTAGVSAAGLADTNGFRLDAAYSALSSDASAAAIERGPGLAKRVFESAKLLLNGASGWLWRAQMNETI